ncbi:MAG: PsiF family protein [Metallibacterium scheffleri]
MQIRLIASLALACLLFAGGASAATTASGKTMTPQQQRMAECSHQSKGMHGAEHKTFMSHCMKGHAAMPMATAKHEMAKPGMMGGKAMQNEKMKTCSVEAKAKKLMGAERKTFMSECLKAH